MSKIILVGSPPIGGGILSSVAEILEMIKGLGFKDKKFGKDNKLKKNVVDNLSLNYFPYLIAF